MSKLKELIRELCPDGVEYKKLGECIEIYTGIQFNKRDMSEVGTYPVLNGGMNPSGFTEKYNEEKDTITVSQGGASAGYVNWMDCKFWAGAHCFVVKPNNNILNNRYLYFLLKNSEKILMQAKHGAGIPGLNRDKVKNLIMPVPPLPIQEEIVRILDLFTDLAAELQAELQARREQYEYYRDKLLTFDKVSRGGILNVTWMTMSELFDMRNGYTPSKANPMYWENGTIPWFRMEDIRTNGRILSDSIQHITQDAVKGGKLFPSNSFIIATTATIGEHALLIADSLANQQFTNLQVRKSLIDRINIKFLYYYMYIVGMWCRNNTNVSGFASVDMKKLKKLPIPVPSLAEQERIVSILDKFETLVNDLAEGLPAEMAAVQEQYEYYRNKLLSFPRFAAGA